MEVDMGVSNVEAALRLPFLIGLKEKLKGNTNRCSGSPGRHTHIRGFPKAESSLPEFSHPQLP